MRAGLAGAVDDSFTVTVSDGQHGIPITVENIPVSSAQLTVSSMGQGGPNTIPFGATPLGVAISPDGRLAYVTDGDDGKIYVLDTATHTLVDTNPATAAVDSIALGGRPNRVVFSPDGSLAYVSNQISGTVSVIDTATHTVTDTNPATPEVDPISFGSGTIRVAFSPDGSLAYITAFGSVAVIDTATHTFIDANPATPAVDNISVPGGGSVTSVAFSPDGSFAYVTNTGSRTVTVIDTATHTRVDINPATPTVDRIPVGDNPISVVFSPDGRIAYVSNSGSGTVSVIDTATHAVIDADPTTPTVDPIPIGFGAGQTVFSPDGSLAYLTEPDSQSIYVIDIATHTVIDTNPATPEVDTIPVGDIAPSSRSAPTAASSTSPTKTGAQSQ